LRAGHQQVCPSNQQISKSASLANQQPAVDAGKSACLTKTNEQHQQHQQHHDHDPGVGWSNKAIHVVGNE